MRVASEGLLLVWVALGLACGGGSSSGGVIPPSTVTASFQSATYTPASNQVTMAQAANSGDTVTVSVDVSNTTGLYGAGFNVSYDSSRVAFVSYSNGTLLETGGYQPTYIVSPQPSQNHVVVNISRKGSEPAVNVSGTKTLVRLTFRVLATGTSTLAFESPMSLSDAQAPPQPIPNSSWYGGSLLGS